MPYGVSLNGDEDFDKDKKISNKKLESRLQMLARDLVVYGKTLRKQFLRDLEGSDISTFAAYYRK